MRSFKTISGERGWSTTLPVQAGEGGHADQRTPSSSRDVSSKNLAGNELQDLGGARPAFPARPFFRQDGDGGFSRSGGWMSVISPPLEPGLRIPILEVGQLFLVAGRT